MTAMEGSGALLGEGQMIGSESLRAYLQGEIAQGTLSHAYLIEGQSGAGKHLLSSLLCAAACCSERGRGQSLPCGKCPSCEKILSGKSVDVQMIGKSGKTSIGVDDVRFLRSDVLIPPNDLNYKFYIIEDAQDLTVPAQNALLLTLEEPPPYVVFFLLCENAGNMLETVRSRAPSLRLSPVDDEQLRAHLAAQQSAFAQMSAAEQDELLRMAQGSVGQALRLLDGRARKPMVERRRFVSQLIQVCFTSQADALQKTECIKGFGSVREEVLNRLTLLQQAMRDLILLKRCETATLVFYSDREAALRIATACATVRLISFYEQVELARTRILKNANIRLALTALLLAESTAAVKSV